MTGTLFAACESLGRLASQFPADRIGRVDAFGSTSRLRFLFIPGGDRRRSEELVR